MNRRLNLNEIIKLDLFILYLFFFIFVSKMENVKKVKVVCFINSRQITNTQN